MLEYRNASKELEGDRENGGFVGIVSDFDESSEGEGEGEGEGEQFNIPDSEWKKVIGYIEKGSNFETVGKACSKNKLKLKSRFLILKALGLDNEAEDILRGSGHMYDLTKQLMAMPIP